MQIFTGLESFSPDSGSPLILGLGNFDGVHLGHRRLLSGVLKDAAARRGKSAVFTFREHPQSVLHPSARPALLTSPEQRLMIFKELGIEICFFLPFTQEFARTGPEDFVNGILKKKLNAAKIFLGYNARFGHERRGDSKMMARLAGEHGFEFEEIPPVEAEGGIVSSSRIRQFIQEGKLKEAEGCLGRRFSIVCKVIQGDGRGKSTGYPTANLDAGAYALPPYGVYPVRVRIFTGNKEWLRGVLNYGLRPTFEAGAAQAVPEVFILDFSGDLYGKTLEVEFYPRLREEKAFESAGALQRQIAQDVEAARRMLEK